MNGNWLQIKHTTRRSVVDGCVYKLLIGLNDEFDEVRSRVTDKKLVFSINKFFFRFTRRKVVEVLCWARKVKTETSAFMIEATANKVSLLPNKLWVWCANCNKPRHTREICWKIHVKPANWKSNKQGDSSNNQFVPPIANSVDDNPFSKEQVDQLLKLLKINSPSGNPSTSLTQTSNCPQVFCCLNSFVNHRFWSFRPYDYYISIFLLIFLALRNFDL